MREQEVWRTTVDWAEDNGYSVIAACPPGSSVYDYRRFCIVDPQNKKRDEPDILMKKGKDVYIVECKVTQKDCLRIVAKTKSVESDVDKLRRIKKSMDVGMYDQQLFDNYGIDRKNCIIHIALAFYQNGIPDSIRGFTQFVWQGGSTIQIVE